MKIWLLILWSFCSFGLLLTSPLLAETDLQIEQAISVILKDRHPQDNADWWRSLGPTAPQVIISMYEKTHNIYHRIRLTEALGWFNHEDGVKFLKQEAQANPNRLIKETAIRSIGISQGLKEQKFLESLLYNEDPRLRAAAAQGLAGETRYQKSNKKVVQIQIIKE